MNCEKAEPAKPRLPTRHPNDNDEEQVATVPALTGPRARQGVAREHNNAAGTRDDRRTANFVSMGREGGSESGANLLTQSMGGDNEVTEKSHIVKWTNAKQIIFITKL